MVMKCKVSSLCGGCQNVNGDYLQTTKEKEKYIKELFAGIGNVEDIVTNYYPYKYRNKLQLAFTQLKGKTIMGFFEEGSTKVTDIDGCILNGDWSYTLIAILREYISRFKIRGYYMGAGILRYAHARCIGNALQLTLCVTTDNFPGRDWLYNKLCQNFKSVSLYLNINKRTDRAVFDKVFKYVAGDKYLQFNFCGVNVGLHPASFLQVNLGIAEKMYKKANEMLEINAGTTVLDLYCGIGITSVLFGKSAKNVLAIEENPKAINNAIYIAKNNNVNNIKFVADKCENCINLISNNDDLVAFVDPARNGMESALVEHLKKLNLRKMVYMSCNPETALRDIKILLADNKYKVATIIPWDMFPFTKHIELLIEIVRADNE